MSVAYQKNGTIFINAPGWQQVVLTKFRRMLSVFLGCS